MITAANRFHGHNSLNYVYRNGKTVRGPLFALKYTPNARRQTYRLAIVVSKKVHKTAVGRNRIRRRLYEVFRSYNDRITEPYDMVVSVFTDSLIDLPIEELRKAVFAQLRQAGIIK